MVEICYYKTLSEKRVINIKEALVKMISYKECKKCHGLNINCRYYETADSLRNIGKVGNVGRIEDGIEGVVSFDDRFKVQTGGLGN